MFFSKKLLKFKNLKHCFFSRKDGFSDGVSSFEKPWYEIINEHTQKVHGCSEKEY